MLPGVPGFFGRRGGNFLDPNVLAVRTVKIHRLLRDEIDNALEVRFLADGQLHEHGVASELGAELLDHLLRIGAGAVHLVDERQPRHVVAPHLPIDGERLRLYAADGAKHEDRAVEHAEAAFHFDGEIDVAGRVDEIDRGIAPGDGGGRAGDGDPALLFEVHVVHRRAAAGAAVMDFLHAVNPPGIVQDPLAQRGLAGVDVRRNADVAKFGNVHEPRRGSESKNSLYSFPCKEHGNEFGT